MEKDFLKIVNLTKIFHLPDQVPALNNVSLSVASGEFITIVGSNAAGKTTLLNSLTGTISPTIGDIILNGRSIINYPIFQRARLISIVRQNPADNLLPGMTLGENMALAKLRGVSCSMRQGIKKEWRQEFYKKLKFFQIGLEEKMDEKASTLSGGQQQTAAVIMAALAKPQLILFDEHTANLDPLMSKIILEITEKIVRETRTAALMVTHNLANALYYGDRIVLFKKGTITFTAGPDLKRKLSAKNLEERMND